MKDGRKLRLVPPSKDGDERGAPPGPPGLIGPTGSIEPSDEPAPTEAELREALALRDAMEQGTDPLAASLQAAFRPAPLDDADHDVLLARALVVTRSPDGAVVTTRSPDGAVEGAGGGAGDEARPTKAELREAARLAGELDAMDTALQSGRGVDPEARTRTGEAAELAGALRSAWAPRGIDPLRNEALIAQVLRRAPAGRSGARTVSMTVVAFTTFVAMAAGVVLLIGRMGQLGAPAPQSAASPAPAAVQVAHLPFIRARSTTELFDPETPFPRTGGTSARIDRIASARASDLRANRFAAWGVR